MPLQQPFFQQLKQRVIAWAQSEEDIRAVILTGSSARQNHPADQYSDLDIELWTPNPERYYRQPDWINSFGEVWTMFSVPVPEDDRHQQWLVLYAGGYKVDFSPMQIDLPRELVKEKRLFDSMQRGYDIWVDKDGLAAQLQPPNLHEPPPYDPPSESDLNGLVGEFFYGAVYVGKQIKRGNLWKIKWADVYQQKALLQMLEWHAHATQAGSTDTWYDGNYMREWVSDEVWKAIHGVFAHFDADDSRRALFVSIALFRRLGSETAQRLGYHYNDHLDNQVGAYLHELLG